MQSHDAKTASVMVSKGKHGDILMRSISTESVPDCRGRRMHPALFMVAGLEMLTVRMNTIAPAGSSAKGSRSSTCQNRPSCSG